MEERYRNSNRISGRRLQARRLAISAAFALTLGASATEPQVDVVADVGHQGPIDGMTYSSDGRWLMTSCRPSDGTTRLWFESRLRYVLPGSRAAMPPSGELVVTGSEDAFRQLGAIRRWDLATGRMKWEALGREVHSFAVTPDGTSLVALGKDKSYQVWDIETGEVRQRLAGFAPGLGEIFVSPLGTWVATRYRNTIATWELSTGQARCLLAEEPNSVRQLTFAPREQFIVAAGKGTVRLWDPETCELRHRFETDDERLDRGLVSPDGAYVLASSSRQALLWHRESGELVYQATELEHCSGFSAIAFHPSGDWAAIGRRNGRIDLVAPEIGMPIQTLKSSFGPSLLVPHPDGTELTAGAHGINFLRLKSDNYTKRGRQSHLKLEALYLSEDAEQLVAQNA
ncbi:MAG: WD40 repeat domain-containing protein, partial [Acidobacteriota bacterium]